MKHYTAVNEWACKQWQDSELGDKRRNKRASEAPRSKLRGILF